jgi:hypothetical protein
MRTQGLSPAPAIIVTLVLVAGRAGVAQTQRLTTPWGDPDPQGTWSNHTPVSFERPAELAGKARYTRKEADELEMTHGKRLLETADAVQARSRSTERPNPIHC